MGEQVLQLQERDFRLRDGKGGEYPVSPDGSLGYYLKTKLPNPFITPVEPSLGINTAVVFDVPPDARGLTLRVQSGPFGDEHVIDLKQ